MASTGLNKWIVSGNLGADVQVKTVDLRSGEKAQVATATLYVRGVRDRKESFTVSLSIWERSAAWRRLPYLKKGSLVICTGSVEPRPYLSSVDNRPRAGLSMSVLDITLDIVKDGDEPEEIQDFSSEVANEEVNHADAPDLATVGG
ncbi:MAG: single-stranded DNA-binding protein [Elainellaceae cyanobacterium]